MIAERLDDDDGYYVDFILSANFMRKHLTPNELHIIDARQEPDYPEKLVMPEARLIVRHEDLAKQVGRSLSLNKAYELAIERTRKLLNRKKITNDSSSCAVRRRFLRLGLMKAHCRSIRLLPEPKRPRQRRY